MWRKRELEPLQRGGLRSWTAFTVRLAISCSLVVIAFCLLWFDRNGLRDNVDGHLSLADTLYFTMITISTVGYGDIVPVSERARLIDAFFITPIRIFLWLIFLGTAAELLLRNRWRNWRMRNIQRTLEDHIVLAGFGRSGQCALEELLAAGTDPATIVVIDPDQERVDLAKAAGVAAMREDSTRDEVQKAVQLDRARTLMVSCGRDDTSVLTVLTARHLAPSLRIAVAIRNFDNEAVARKAGADIVVNPVSFAGLLLASTSRSDHIADYLSDLATSEGRMKLRERTVAEREVGKLLSEVSGGRALRIYRGSDILCPDDAEPPRVEAGDTIIEIVRK